jgi:hypothetical protein
MGEVRNAYKFLVGKLERDRLLERPCRSWVNEIRIDLMEIGWKAVEWIHLA